MTKKAEVSLVSWTPDAIPLMCWTRRVMHSPVPDTLKELKENPEKWLGMSMDDYFENVLLKDGMPTFLEYVNLTFKLENVSRALQQQLTRHRIGFSYSIQSLRCVDLPNFASEGAYHNPYKEGTEEHKEYHQAMLNVQGTYRELLKSDTATQDARGVLPMNIHSTVTFSCSLRAFIGLVNKRLCNKVQGEFREVAVQMAQQVYDNIDPRLRKYIGAPCDIFGKCMMKGENEEQLRQNKLTGKQNTDHVCPKYVAKFVKDGKIRW